MRDAYSVRTAGLRSARQGIVRGVAEEDAECFHSGLHSRFADGNRFWWILSARENLSKGKVRTEINKTSSRNGEDVSVSTFSLYKVLAAIATYKNYMGVV